MDTFHIHTTIYLLSIAGDLQATILNLSSLATPVMIPIIVMFGIKGIAVLNRAVGRLNDPNKGPIDAVRRNLEARKEERKAGLDLQRRRATPPGDPNTKAGRLRRRAWGMGTAAGRLQGSDDRAYSISQLKKASSDAQAERLPSRIKNDRKFAERLVGGSRAPEESVERVTRQAEDALVKLHHQAVSEAESSLSRAGVSGDRPSLERIIRDQNSDKYKVEAAAGLLLKTAGTEEYGRILRDKSLFRDSNGSALPNAEARAEALISAGQANGSILESKSPDIADFVNQAAAVKITQAGHAAHVGSPAVESEFKTQGVEIRDDQGKQVVQGIFEQGRVRGFSGGKLLTVDVATIARAAEAVSASGDKTAIEALQKQAQLALANTRGFGEAKPPVQQIITALATGVTIDVSKSGTGTATITMPPPPPLAPGTILPSGGQVPLAPVTNGSNLQFPTPPVAAVSTGTFGPAPTGAAINLPPPSNLYGPPPTGPVTNLPPPTTPYGPAPTGSANQNIPPPANLYPPAGPPANLPPPSNP